jgi:hypothetical protein
MDNSNIMVFLIDISFNNSAFAKAEKYKLTSKLIAFL